MSTVFDFMATCLEQRRGGHGDKQGRRSGRTYRCHCGRAIFFNNSVCLSCGAAVGYVPELQSMRSFRPGPVAGTLSLAVVSDDEVVAAGSAVWRPCENLHAVAGCNWMLSLDSLAIWCIACRLNRTIPDLSTGENALRWAKVEAAKRRLIAQLLELGLPVRSKVDDPRGGLAFDFLASDPGQARVLTGHAGGLITLNIEEADESVRERLRVAMNEPYRTLLGHFRHEIGHYYWDQLIRSTGWLEDFRRLFGDERVDYAEAVRLNYVTPPLPDWPWRYVTAYASVHPWEDWAETWGHYMHIVDTLTTALGFGLGGTDVGFYAEPFTSEALYDPRAAEGETFLSLMNAWVELTAVMNELSRSMGQRDLYPFVLSPMAVTKLHFVHLVITGVAGQSS